jgi:hypothetical protein
VIVGQLVFFDLEAGVINQVGRTGVVLSTLIAEEGAAARGTWVVTAEE